MLCPNHLTEKRLVSNSVGYCPECLITDSRLLDQVLNMHRAHRERSGLIPTVPTTGTLVCAECANHCRLNEGEIGFCHSRKATASRIVERFPGKALVYWYFDPLPTNCVAEWVCSLTKPENKSCLPYLKNLAVFYGSCSSDCLFCQNISYRDMMARGRPLMTPAELASVADDRTACICYFGGDPSCNAKHSIETGKLLRQERDLKVCYETNGLVSGKWLQQIADMVWESRGPIKFDLKAYTPELYAALTGVSNVSVLKNFRTLAQRGKKREEEFLIASILLVPGYVGVSEVRRLADSIAGCDPTIPTALLGFFPHHMMSDLPCTSRAHANAAVKAAQDAGLTNVRVGNRGLLSSADYLFG